MSLLNDAPDWIIADVAKNESAELNRRLEYAKMLLKRKSPFANDPEISKILFARESIVTKRASFDVWDTIITRRSIKDLHCDPKGVFGIAENIIKVRPGDLLISDHHASYDFLKGLIEYTTGLKNELYLSENDKLTGKVWKELKNTISFHYGDNIAADYNVPKGYGIPAHLYIGSSPTDIESILLNEFSDLALTMRQARLMTYNQKYRDFQHLQTQINFPLLYLASLFLHARCLQGNIVKILMSSRDTCLLVQLYNRMAELGKWEERAVYFYSSRMARNKPSLEYLNYIKTLLVNNSMVLDLCGIGASLPRLIDRINPKIPIVIVGKYPFKDVPVNRSEPLLNYHIEAWANIIECPNLARHPQFLDIVNGQPRFFNPANISWETQPELRIAHETFALCVSLLEGPVPSVGLADTYIQRLINDLQNNSAANSLLFILENEEPFIAPYLHL